MSGYLNKIILSLFTALFAILSGCVTIPETGRKAFILIPESQEEAIGAQAYHETLAKEHISTNQRWTEILSRVGRRIAAVANKPEYKWEFKLIESSQKNAFCLPGGKVAFYTGIFPLAQNEAGIAAIMGHEVAHATARHGGQRMTLAVGAQLGLLAASALISDKNPDTKKLILLSLGLGTQFGAMLPFSRSHEAEADEIGLIYMAKAGYDPAEASRLWARFAHSEGSKVPTFLSTHPASEDRMNELHTQLPSVEHYYRTSKVKYGLGETL